MSLRGYLERKMVECPGLFDSDQSWWMQDTARYLLWSLMQASMGARGDQASSDSLGMVLTEQGEEYTGETGNFQHYGGLKSVFGMIGQRGSHLGIANYGLCVPSPTPHDPERTQLFEQGKVFPLNQHVGLWVTEVGRERYQTVTVGLPVVSDELVGHVRTESLQNTSFNYLKCMSSVLYALERVSNSNLRVEVYHHYPEESDEAGAYPSHGGPESGRIPRAAVFDAVIALMSQDGWNPTTLGNLSAFTEMIINGLTLDHGYTRWGNDSLSLMNLQTADYDLLPCRIQEAYGALVEAAITDCDEDVLLAVGTGMGMFSTTQSELGDAKMLGRAERENLSNLGKLSVANTLLSVCLQHRIVLD